MNVPAKRIFDLLVAGVGMILLSPALVAIALLIKLDDCGPVLIRHPRVGYRSRIFTLYKFRTMVSGADRTGPSVTVHNDPRVTRIGRMLRRCDLDELPSLFNVLRGEMSIVGPRPEVPKYLPYYTDEQRLVFSVKPGLTDLGTLAFRNEAAMLATRDPDKIYVHEILPSKLALNLGYVRRQSFFLDLAIIVRTLALVAIQPKG